MSADDDVTRREPAQQAVEELPRLSMKQSRRTIGRYRLSYEIASGGQATVYVGVAEGPSGFEKVVAIKILHRRFAADPSSVTQFLDEARLAARLTHPNICGVMDFGIDGDDHFLVMEFIPGVTVAQLLARAAELRAAGKLDSKRWGALAGLVLGSVAEGLYAVHDLRDAAGKLLHAVHRDVTPRNILCGFDGSVRLMDFGIAKHDAQMGQSAAGTIKGTAAYLAPEYARGDGIDGRADIWSLGVVAWELLCVRRLFKRPNPLDTVLAVLEDEIPAPSSIDPAWGAVDGAFRGVLSRDPARRRADPRSFATAFADALGRARPSELAEWIRNAFPHAEVESRSLVDLARQSAGDVPMASAAIEEQKSHLAAIALLQSARAMLARLLEGTDAPMFDDHLLECRMTLLQAGRAWPDNTEIRAATDQALGLAARRELKVKNVEAARALMAQMNSNDAWLDGELEAVEAALQEGRAEAARLERVAKEHDLRVGYRARVASMAALTLGAVAIAFFSLVSAPSALSHEVLLRIAGAQVGITLLFVVGLWRQLAENAAGRKFAALIVAVTVSGLLHRVVSAHHGVPPAVILSTDLVRHGLAVAAAGLLVPRTAWSVLIPLTALGLTFAFPDETARIVSLSSVLTLVAVTVLGLAGLRPEPKPT